MAKKISIHIADDHQVLLDGLKAVLQLDDELEVVGSSLNGEEVLQWFKNNTADVLILDISMDKMDGIQLLKEFKKGITPSNPIILSSYDDIKLIKEVLKLGALGFLSKKCAADHIIEAVKTVANGNQYFSPSINEKIVKSFSGISAVNIDNNNDGALINILTEREIEILKLIALEYTSKEISKSLFISTNTVESHRKNMMKKLKIKSSIGLAKFALKNNLIK